MRTKEAFKNLITSLLLEVAVALSGILIPRFFTALYGSTVNGLVSSIGQFITYMGLVEAGISAAGTVALYGPLAQKDSLKISELVSTARSFYFRSGWIFVGLVAALVAVYPFIVKNEIADAGFVRMMIVILSVNGIVDYFFLGKYRVLLTADQKVYIIYSVQIVGIVVMTVASLVLIHLQCSALLVKAVVAIVYVLRSLAVALYVKKAYPDINFRAKPNMGLFNQRWAALLHQVVGMIVNNTSLVLLTVMLKTNALVEVSIYSTYNLVANAIRTLLTSLGNSINSSFGQVIANKETDVLKTSFSTYEYLFFMLTFFFHICMTVLLYPFIDLYCSEFLDGHLYLQWPLVALFSLVGLVQTLRIPSMTVYLAAGHFKETRSRAVLEAVINLTVSLALVRPFGIVGVLLGTLASYTYRTVDVLFYSAKRFLPGTLGKTFRRIVRNGITAAVLIWLGIRFIPSAMDGWFAWFAYAVAAAVLTALALAVVNFVFEKNEFMAAFARIKDITKRKTAPQQ